MREIKQESSAELNRSGEVEGPAEMGILVGCSPSEVSHGAHLPKASSWLWESCCSAVDAETELQRLISSCSSLARSPQSPGMANDSN